MASGNSGGSTDGVISSVTLRSVAGGPSLLPSPERSVSCIASHSGLPTSISCTCESYVAVNPVATTSSSLSLSSSTAVLPVHRNPRSAVVASPAASASVLNITPSQSVGVAESQCESDDRRVSFSPEDGVALGGGTWRSDAHEAGSPTALSRMLDHSCRPACGESSTYTVTLHNDTLGDTTADHTFSESSDCCSDSCVKEPPPRLLRRGKLSLSTRKAQGHSESKGNFNLSPRFTCSKKRLALPSNTNGFKGRGKGCGKCPPCTLGDCGVCSFCKDKPKFGGPGKKKQRCVCSNPGAEQGRLQVAAPPERYKLLEDLCTGESVAEILQFYEEDRAVPKCSVEITQQSQILSCDGESELHLQTLAEQFVEKQNVDIAAKGNTTAAPSIVNHGVVPKPLQITQPLQTEEPIETSTTVSKDVTRLKHQPPETKVLTETETHNLDLWTTTRGECGVEKTAPPAKRTKQQRKNGGSFLGEFTMNCAFCGRQRKLTVARSEKFCSQRCIQQWLEAHPGEDPEAVVPEVKHITDVTPVIRHKKTKSRELKNLQIDMALPGKSPPLAVSQDCLPPYKPLSPVLGPCPRPVPSPVVVCKASPSVKMTSSEGREAGQRNSGTKRSSASQPEPKKKLGECYHGGKSAIAPKGADMIGSTCTETSTVLPISAPLLTLTVPSPPVTIKPASSAFSNLTELYPHSRVLPSSIENWSHEHVAQYMGSIQDCWDYAGIFREHELDGPALLLLTHESLVKCLGIKLGRALKIMQHVEELRKFHDPSL